MIAKKVIDNDFFVGYETDSKREAHLEVDNSKGELLYYIGTWKTVKVLAKKSKDKIKFVVIHDENRAFSKETDKETFNELLLEIKLRYGEPDNEKDFSMCKDIEEQNKILKGDNNEI